MTTIDESANSEGHGRSEQRRDALLAEYGEVNNNFRLLTDIRFKLLALLPIAAAAATAVLSGGGRDAAAEARALGLSLFGLLVTFALATYNARNDQLYNTLVGRAASIERHLNLPDGAFANRPTPWFTVNIPGLNKGWKIDHGAPVALIYGASLALWLFSFGVALLQLFWGDSEAPRSLLASLILPAALVPVFAVGRVRRQHRARSDAMRSDAEAAVKVATDAGLARAADNKTFRETCQRLGGVEESEVLARALFYSGLAPVEERHFALDGPDSLRAANFVALITDLPTEWIHDCVSERRKQLPGAEPLSGT